MCQQRQEFFVTPRVVQSPQRVENRRPGAEDVLCSRLITKGRTICKLDILDTYLSFWLVGRPEWTYLVRRCKRSGFHRDRSGIPLGQLGRGRVCPYPEPHRHPFRLDRIAGALGRSQIVVQQALDEIEGVLPFGLLGVDTDNESDFINWHLKGWCEQKTACAVFTRQREKEKGPRHWLCSRPPPWDGWTRPYSAAAGRRWWCSSPRRFRSASAGSGAGC